MTKQKQKIFFYFLIVTFFFAAKSVKAAAISNVTGQAAGTYNWSDASTWQGGVVPGDGDSVTINPPASGVITIVVNQDTTVGVISGSTNGVKLKATNASTYVKLQVASGVRFTMKGPGTTSSAYTAMNIAQYAQFEPLSGSRVEVDNSANTNLAGIVNNGIINAIGTSGSPIVFSIPMSDKTKPWQGRTADLSLTSFSSSNWYYRGNDNIASARLAKMRIANSAKTNVGNYQDSSVVFSNQSPSNILAPGQEKASIDAIQNPGDYYIDYASGFVYFKHDYSAGNPTFQYTLSYLDDTAANWKGWNIDSTANAAYNEAKFQYCTFEYMGGIGQWSKQAIAVAYKKSPSVVPNRQFFLKNSTLQWLGGSLLLGDQNVGTESDPILIDSNIFRGFSMETTGTTDYALPSGSTQSYITISNNTIYNDTFLLGGTTGSTFDHFNLINNTQYSSTAFFGDFIPISLWLSDSLISGNTIYGAGGYPGTRLLLDVGGVKDHPVIITNNNFNDAIVGIIVDRYAVIEKNIFKNCFTGIRAQVGSVTLAEDVTIQNNLFFGTNVKSGTWLDGGAIAFWSSSVSYHTWIDHWIVSNNTIVDYYSGAFTLGTAGGTTFISRSVFANNLITKSSIGQYRYAFNQIADTGGGGITRGVFADLENNLATAPSAGYTNGALNSKFYGTFLLNGSNYNTNARNLTGVEIGNSTYTTDQTGRNLSLSVNNPASDMTLTWGGGDPVQLVWQADGSQVSSAQFDLISGSTTWGARIYDNSKNWSTIRNDINNPSGRWLKLTSGSGAGPNGRKIFLIVSSGTNYVDVMPFGPTANPGTLPQAGDTYEIINSQAYLYDSQGSTGGKITAGIRLEDLPTASTSDSNISFTADTLITADPKIVNLTGSTAADFQTQAGGAGIDQAKNTHAPTKDFFDIARPQGAASDIGFFEYPSGTQFYSVSNFISLVASWLHKGTNTYDLNYDSIINSRDLGIMMSKWN